MPRTKKVQTSAQDVTAVVTKEEFFNLEYLEGRTKKIKDSINTISKAFIDVGYELWHIRHNKLYLLKGYKDLVEYSEKELNFKKRSTYNFISIVENFCQFNDGYPTVFLKEEYSDFGYSQLSEMLSLSEDDKKNVTPDMTVKQIRESKKPKKEELTEEEQELDQVELSYIPSEKLQLEEQFNLYLKEKVSYYKDILKGLTKNSEFYYKAEGRIEAYNEILRDLVLDMIK
jgi:hypothetical protein